MKGLFHKSTYVQQATLSALLVSAGDAHSTMSAIVECPAKEPS